MKPLRTKRAPKWHFDVAMVFALLRERCFEIDTIPKPGGLGFASAHCARSVPALSHICPTFVPVLSHFSAGSVYALERRWQTSFTMS